MKLENHNTEKSIYLDNAATTKVDLEVFEAMKPYFIDYYGNPSSVYSFGGKTKKAIEESRKVVADFIGAQPNEIYFTGGGSESDNWALKATAFACKDKGKHIITTKIEHHAILNTCDYLEKLGFDITYLSVDENGFVNLEEMEKAIRPDTILISVMYANNEIGTIEQIEEIGRIAHKHNVLFHTDAVQAYGHLRINVKAENIDLMSASGHKLNGPKGIGILYISNSVKMGSFIHGGSQERSRRAGTQNVPGIIGFAKATQIADRNLENVNKDLKKLRDYCIDELTTKIPDIKINGDRIQRLSNNINVSFSNISGESLLIMLDQKNIFASSGSACTSGSLNPSHVLLAIGLDKQLAKGTLRITMSEENTKEDMDYVIEEIKNNVERLRSMSEMNFD